MLFILSIFFLSLKLTLQILEFLVAYKGPFIKVVLILILLEIIYLLITVGLSKYLKLSELRNSRLRYFSRYQIADRRDQLWNIGYILFYISIFIGGILWLRFSNSKNTFDIIEKLKEIKELILLNSWVDNGLSMVIIVLIIVIYLQIIIKSNERFGFEVIRLHIFLVRSKKYEKLFLGFPIGTKKFYYYFMLHNITLHSLPYDLFLRKIDRKIMMPLLAYYKIHKNFLYYCHQIIIHLHYIILLVVLIYDLIINNLVLINYFKFLPYFFIYMLWLRFSNAIDRINLMRDYNLSIILYGNVEIIDNEIFVDGLYMFPLETLIEYHEYLSYGLYDMERREMDNKSKGRLTIGIENVTKRILSNQLIKKLVKYNYRAKLIQMHRLNVKLMKVTIIISILLVPIIA